MSTRLATAASKFLGSRSSRRGFLTRTALTGTALAVAPIDYLVHPKSAYAAVCNCSGSSCDCGSLCCDGYTEFCCHTTGANTCPPGTVAAGWWKADGSGLCGPAAARYYLDCNAVSCGSCGCGSSGTCPPSCSGLNCGCAFGSCNNRKHNCVAFRYGQCNQDISCLGAIVCRVVTCTPPWVMDSKCTATVATDNATRFHNRPCLSEAPFGAFDFASTSGGKLQVAGWTADSNSDRKVTVHVYVSGRLVTAAFANRSRPDVARVVPGIGPDHGFNITMPISPGVHQVCVYAIDDMGQFNNRLLGCKTVDSRDKAAIGSLDVATPQGDTVRVAGWAADQDTPSSVAKVHVYIDNRFAGVANADRLRPDVGAAFPGLGNNHGFSASFPVGPGQHTVCVYGINTRPGGVNSLLGCRTFTSGDRTPTGSLDTVTQSGGTVVAGGWAADFDTPTTSAQVHLYVDNQFAGRTVASLPRSDVGTIFPALGPSHGFRAELSIGPGRHVVCAYAINTRSGGAHTFLGCRTIDVV